MRRRLFAAGYVALVGAGTVASVELWLHAFSVRETLTAAELALPGAHQRAVPEFVLPQGVTTRESPGRTSSPSANPLLTPEFLSGAAAVPSVGAVSPTRPATPAAPGSGSQPQAPVVVAPQEQPVAAGNTTGSGSPQAASSPNRALQKSVRKKTRSKGRKPSRRASRGRAAHVSPATAPAPAPRTKRGRHAPPKHDAKPAKADKAGKGPTGKAGKAPKPAPPAAKAGKAGKAPKPAPPAAKVGKAGKAPKPAPPAASSGAPNSSPPGHADHPGGGHGNGHGK